MHHVTLDQWSRGASLLHQRDPRVKIAAVLAFLVVLATATPPQMPVPVWTSALEARLRAWQQGGQDK